MYCSTLALLIPWRKSTRPSTSTMPTRCPFYENSFPWNNTYEVNTLDSKNHFRVKWPSRPRVKVCAVWFLIDCCDLPCHKWHIFVQRWQWKLRMRFAAILSRPHCVKSSNEFLGQFAKLSSGPCDRAVIGSDNGLSPLRPQSIPCINADQLSIKLHGTHLMKLYISNSEVFVQKKNEKYRHFFRLRWLTKRRYCCFGGIHCCVNTRTTRVRNTPNSPESRSQCTTKPLI